MTLAGACSDPPVPPQPLKLLVFAHTPPPHHGQSYMVQMLLEGFGGDQAGRSVPEPHPRGVACYHVNARFSEGIADIGGFRLIKLWLLLGYFARAVWYRFRHGVKTFYYVPAPPQRMPVLRDWLVMLLCRPFFPRLVLHWHGVGLGEWLRGRGPVTRWLTHAALGRAQLALVLAEANRADAATLTPERIAIVPNGIPDPCPDFDQHWRSRRRERAARLATALDKTGGDGASGERIRVLFIALCSREKGLFDALAGVAEANARLAATGCVARFELQVAGDFIDRAEQEEFERIVAAPEWAGLCQYHGFVTREAKERLFAEADMLVFPSYYHAESFGLVVAEAMARGLPVIATRWRAIPEVLPPGYPYLVEPRAPGQIADALLRAARDREPADLRGRFVQEFTIERHIDALAGALRSLDAPPARPGLKLPSRLCVKTQNTRPV
jgi:glycosyltransferase involved in cell wall biosynthesis